MTTEGGLVGAARQVSTYSMSAAYYQSTSRAHASQS